MHSDLPPGKVLDEEKYSRAIEALKSERQELLISYCDLLALDMEHLTSLPQSLMQFNQLLTDYAALGHFELFESVAAKTQEPALDQISNSLRDVTQQFLGFGERIQPQNGNSAPNLALVSRDLEQLGQVMAERFELEDRFILTLANSA